MCRKDASNCNTYLLSRFTFQNYQLNNKLAMIVLKFRFPFLLTEGWIVLRKLHQLEYSQYLFNIKIRLWIYRSSWFILDPKFSYDLLQL